MQIYYKQYRMMSKFRQIIEASTKSDSIKREILRLFSLKGNSCISDISKELNLSVPTITKFILELIEDGYVLDFGKQDTAGGRRPNVFGLNPDAGYFIGITIKKHSLSLGVINFNGKNLIAQARIEFKQANTPESLDELCHAIDSFIKKNGLPKDKIAGIAINISGRVNASSGYSYSCYNFNEEPLTDILERKLGYKVFIDNDSRAMCYGEYICGNITNEKNIIFINVSRGLGMGLIIDGKLYYGHSGFSGEFGHTPSYNNEIFCHCGKKGCLETEASGAAIHRILLEKHNLGERSILSKMIEKNIDIKIEDLVNAINKEDILMIDILEQIATNLGKGIAGLVNIFNPELIIIGGSLANTGDYLLLPIKSTVRKYSLNLVNKDSEIRLSSLGEEGGLIGACLIARNRILGLL